MCVCICNTSSLQHFQHKAFKSSHDRPHILNIIGKRRTSATTMTMTKTNTETKIKTNTNTKCLKDPSYVIFSKSRELKDIKYETHSDHQHHQIHQNRQNDQIHQMYSKRRAEKERQLWCKVWGHANNKCKMLPSSYWWDTWDSSKQIYINQESRVSVITGGGDTVCTIVFHHFESDIISTHCQCWSTRRNMGAFVAARRSHVHCIALLLCVGSQPLNWSLKKSNG